MSGRATLPPWQFPLVIANGTATYEFYRFLKDIDRLDKGNAVLVSQLPAASSVPLGYRAFVSDATTATFASVVAGGGTNKVPVYSDQTNWRIG